MGEQENKLKRKASEEDEVDGKFKRKIKQKKKHKKTLKCKI